MCKGFRERASRSVTVRKFCPRQNKMLSEAVVEIGVEQRERKIEKIRKNKETRLRRHKRKQNLRRIQTGPSPAAQ